MIVARLVVVFFAVVCLLPVSGFAQSAEISGGYQFTTSFFTEGESLQSSGWVASAGAYAAPNVVVIGEVSGGYGFGPYGSTSSTATKNHAFMGGAHFLLPSSPVFVRALAGVDNLRREGYFSSTAFAIQHGIGVDVPLGNNAFRITGGYRHAFHEAAGASHNLVLTAGIAAKF